MDANLRSQIILAAIQATPPDDGGRDWFTDVALQAARIAAMVSENSTISKIVDGVGRAKVFTGEVVSVVKEQSSTRGIITLRTGTDRVKEGIPAGHEQIRTDRTDSALGLAMAKQMKSLIGQRVVVWVELEEAGEFKVRVLRHAEVISPATPVSSKPAA